jgi:O-antigen ligase
VQLTAPTTGAEAPSERPERLAGRERAALALLAVSGAVFLPEALNRFVFPKLAVAAAGIALALTVAPRGRLPRPAAILIALAAVDLVLAALTGSTPLAQLLGRPPRYEGALVLAVYVGAAAAGARLLGPGRAAGSTASLLDWLAVASLLIAIEAVLETAGLRPLASDVSRPGSLLGNASDEGAWGVLALGPLASVALRAREPLHIAGAAAAAAVVVCSGSRGALAGAVVAAALLLALLPRPELRMMLAGAVAVTVIAAFLIPATRSRVSGSSPYAGKTASGRLLLWGETARLVGDDPLLGAGPGGFVDAIPAYHDARYERDVGPQTPPDSPHDWLLQAAAAGGVPLLALALALAALTGLRGWRAIARQSNGGEAAAIGGMVCGLAGYGVALLFFFTGPGSTPLAAVMGGALLAAPAAPRPAGAPAPAPRPGLAPPGRARALAIPGAALVCAVLTVVFAAAAIAEIPLRSAIDDVARARLGAADRDFRLARDLRFWDPGIDAEAAHAFAVLAGEGNPAAARAGLPWARGALTRTPDSVEVLSDGAELDLVAGDPGAAVPLLAAAVRLDPANPQLRVEAALAAREAR